jgi:hypothetical protein
MKKPYIIERKVRADAVLRNLSKKTQDLIAQMLEPGRNHKTQDEVREWLARRRIKVAKRALSKFHHSWRAQQEHQQDAAAAHSKSEEWAQKHPDATPQQIFAMGQRIFTRLAMKRENVKMWCATQMLQIRREAQNLSRERHEFHKTMLKKAAATKAAPRTSVLDDDKKVKRVRIKLFGSAPE